MAKHDWFEWRGMVCCRNCGIVKRTKGKNKPCRGEVRITLRQAAADLIEAIDRNLSQQPWPRKYGVPFGEARVLALALDLDATP